MSETQRKDSLAIYPKHTHHHTYLISCNATLISCLMYSYMYVHLKCDIIPKSDIVHRRGLRMYI